jgi:hypothetical protein
MLVTMRCAQEYYADYWALDSALVSLELENNVACFMPQTWESQVRRWICACVTCFPETALTTASLPADAEDV